jgi:hypothetical protein
MHIDTLSELTQLADDPTALGDYAGGRACPRGDRPL